MSQGKGHHSASPTVLLRISDGSCQMHRDFQRFQPGGLRGRGLCRGGIRGRHDLGDGSVLDAVSAPVAENCRLTKPGHLAPDPGKNGAKLGSNLENPGNHQKIELFPRISLDVSGIIVENERQEPR